ncbi:tetratricopeptide repeat protein [Zavarzinella formosa]|uniref:hypothetical protein n=1 Tax=Zavarzinella formosa TaxID=360055 RepID=UPI000304EC65|nr:hypothetical protein [Zavarzinella formosa]
MRFAFLILLSLTPPLLAAPVLPPDNRATVETLRQAADVMEKDDDPDHQRWFWCRVAELRRKIGDRRGEAAAIQRAWEVTEKEDTDGDETKWRPVILTCARLGETAKALKLAAFYPKDCKNLVISPRNEILSEAAEEAALAGQFQAAGEIADAIGYEANRREVREYVRRLEIVARFKAGETKRALRGVTTLSINLLKISALVGEPKERYSQDITAPGDGIADLQLLSKDKAGARQSALQALALIPDAEEHGRRSACVAAVRILCQVDDLAEAKKALARHLAVNRKNKLTPDSDLFLDLLARGHMAVAEVRAGRDEAALAFLKGLDLKGEQAWLLRIIALAQARAGRAEASKASFARAIELVADKEKTDDLCHILGSQALAGDFDGAIMSARQFRCEGVIWEELALLQAKAGDFDGARKTITTGLKAPEYWPTYVLPLIARAQAAAGQPAAVREWSAKLDDPRTRAAVLLGLAEGLVQEPAKPGGK